MPATSNRAEGQIHGQTHGHTIARRTVGILCVGWLLLLLSLLLVLDAPASVVSVPLVAPLLPHDPVWEDAFVTHDSWASASRPVSEHRADPAGVRVLDPELHAQFFRPSADFYTGGSIHYADTWSGRLALPQPRRPDGSVEFHVYHAPAGAAWSGATPLYLTWDDVVRGPFDPCIQFDETTLSKDDSDGSLFHQWHDKWYGKDAAHTEAWTNVTLLETLAGSREVAECVGETLCTRNSVEVLLQGGARLDGDRLYIHEDPLQIAGHEVALVTFISLRDANDTYAARHWNPKTSMFDGPVQRLQIPEGIYADPPSLDGIFDPRINDLGWYVFGELGPTGLWQVRALEPRAVVVTEIPEHAMLEYVQIIDLSRGEHNRIKDTVWADVNSGPRRGIPGHYDTSYLQPSHADVDYRKEPRWQHGDSGLLYSLQGGTKKRGGDRAPRGHFTTGHFDVVRSVFTQGIEFRKYYHHTLVSRETETVAGHAAWAAFYGHRQRGRAHVAPAWDALVRMPMHERLKYMLPAPKSTPGPTKATAGSAAEATATPLVVHRPSSHIAVGIHALDVPDEHNKDTVEEVLADGGGVDSIGGVDVAVAEEGALPLALDTAIGPAAKAAVGAGPAATAATTASAPAMPQSTAAVSSASGAPTDSNPWATAAPVSAAATTSASGSETPSALASGTAPTTLVTPGTTGHSAASAAASPTPTKRSTLYKPNDPNDERLGTWDQLAPPPRLVSEGADHTNFTLVERWKFYADIVTANYRSGYGVGKPDGHHSEFCVQEVMHIHYYMFVDLLDTLLPAVADMSRKRRDHWAGWISMFRHLSAKVLDEQKDRTLWIAQVNGEDNSLDDEAKFRDLDDMKFYNKNPSWGMNRFIKHYVLEKLDMRHTVTRLLTPLSLRNTIISAPR
ncbi:hypothetical protein CXG81DRAFT_23635 [Caulochytrium protostelioides]|uniref:Uncharacterized protein n=1 Tax=Caulochytrium protostelioides TaxID=1555241 RepID=A0A4P9XF88_9FUNG|nr:hypothetical protein CXG81DRAFT_23635 [Caulochytrium protostelioides]|eukprot:RKP03800.1 hypothetical protein CXG81DRAFT_23635 [Caulochytrium protostelioides]